MEGRVKWFDQGKGFGFIELPEGKLAFVRASAIEGEGYRFLSADERVECEVVEAGAGLRAIRVKRPKRAA